MSKQLIDLPIFGKKIYASYKNVIELFWSMLYAIYVWRANPFIFLVC